MKKLLVIFTCLFCLNACSTKLAYNFLDYIVSWYVGQYVSLDRAQKSTFNKDIDRFHLWHRKTQLSRYAIYIDHLIKALQSEKITGEWIHHETDTIQDYLDTSINKLKPTAVQLMSSLSDKQVREIVKNLKKDRKKFRKKYINVSEKKLARQRKNDLLEYIAPFFGKFSHEQKTWIKQWVADVKPYEELTLKQQKIWSTKVKLALDQRHDKSQLQHLADEIMIYRTDDWDPELKEVLDYNQEISYALIARLVNSQSTKQRQRTIKKLKGYRDDLIALSKKS